MSPAEVLSIVVDEENKSMDIAVAEEQLSQAIGRGGQNVRLASELTGWNLNVMSKDDADQKIMEENQNLSAVFKEELNVDQDVADVLAREGFSSIDEVAYCVDTDMINYLYILPEIILVTSLSAIIIIDLFLAPNRNKLFPN